MCFGFGLLRTAVRFSPGSIPHARGVTRGHDPLYEDFDGLGCEPRKRAKGPSTVRDEAEGFDSIF